MASNVFSAIAAQKMKTTNKFRPATPEEAAARGVISGQFEVINGVDGKFFTIQKEEVSRNLTEGQGKATGFYSRAVSAQKILEVVENQGTSTRNWLANELPFGNFIQTPEGQRYNQAKRNFINAILRQESGAAIGADEFANADLQYFPQPGDSPETVEQKRKGRSDAINALKVIAGPGASQPDDFPVEEVPEL
tara:strand:- start:234 stop:812 length:579 start_codon:yes stop_codon:yes gene_type:complete